MGRHECAESGDDEDEELGNAQIRARSPKSKIRGASKLGTEMLRTNSQGSVVSNEEVMATHNLKATAPLTGNEEAAIEEEGATLTPPELFLPPHGMQIEDKDRTPRPHYTSDPDPDPTPRASTSPTRKDWLLERSAKVDDTVSFIVLRGSGFVFFYILHFLCLFCGLFLHDTKFFSAQPGRNTPLHFLRMDFLFLLWFPSKRQNSIACVW
jgi:hypothetical protein